MRGENVLIIVVDALRADHLPCYGYERDTAPNICKFAERGIIFSHAVSQSPWTKPSVASLFTSLYPFHHKTSGLSENTCPDLDDSFLTLAEKLKEEEYYTIGITGNGILCDHNYDQGFDIFIKREDVRVKDQFLRIIEELKRPFFAYLHYMGVHAPYTPPQRYDVYDRWDSTVEVSSGNYRKINRKELILSEDDVNHIIAKYDGEILYKDQMIGDLLKSLESMGIMNSTHVIITSDHGEELLDHGKVWHDYMPRLSGFR
jgi:arylsulfatase A-like enzyme